MSQPPSKVEQHIIEQRSEDQLREAIHDLVWEVDHFGRDYGEDLFVRIFENGNPTGHVFYIQLKGSKKIDNYLLKSGMFSYAFSSKKLNQWRKYPVPVIIMLWDIEKRKGYWEHVQPLIISILKKKPDWLNNPKSERKIRISNDQIFSSMEYTKLKKVIDSEWVNHKLSIGYFKDLQINTINDLKNTIEVNQKFLIEKKDFLKLPENIPINSQQQLIITQLQARVDTNPSDLNAWLGLANIYYDIREFQKSLFASNKTWAIDPQNLNVINSRACILAEYARAKGGPKSMLQEAINLFESLRGRLEESILDYNVGNCYQALGEHQNAIKKYNQALSYSSIPQIQSQIWKNRGTSFFHLEKHKEEINSYKNALKLNPNLWEAYASWATTELHLGNFKKAKDLFIQTIKVNPELESSFYGYPQLYSLAYAHWKLNEFNESYLRINQVLDLDPFHDSGIILKSHLLSELWRDNPLFIVEALYFFKNLLIDNPENWFARNELYLIYESKGSIKDSLSLLEEALSSEDLPPILLYRYALLLEKEDKNKQAINHLESAFKKSQDHHIVHKLANLKKKVGDYNGAIFLYKLTLSDFRDPIPILHSIGECYHLIEDYKECIRYTSKVIILDPINEIAWKNLIFSWIKLGDKKVGYMFDGYFQKINSGCTINEEESNAEVNKLLSIIEVKFGNEFLKTITGNNQKN